MVTGSKLFYTSTSAKKENANEPKANDKIATCLLLITWVSFLVLRNLRNASARKMHERINGNKKTALAIDSFSFASNDIPGYSKEESIPAVRFRTKPVTKIAEYH